MEVVGIRDAAVVTEIVNVSSEPPAVAVFESNVFVTLRCTSSTMATVSVLGVAVSSSEAACAVLPTLGSLSVAVPTW